MLEMAKRRDRPRFFGGKSRCQNLAGLAKVWRKFQNEYVYSASLKFKTWEETKLIYVSCYVDKQE